MANTKYTITSKKIIAVALAFVMLAVMLVGCTKDEPVNNDADKSSTEATSSQSGEDKNEEASNKQSDSTTSTTKANTTTTTTKKNTSNDKTETTTKKNTSSGSSSSKPTSTTTTTTEPTTDCSHKWSDWKNIRLWTQERTCSKCGWIEERELDNRDDYMGTKSEYLEFLSLVNEARREAGLHEIQYLDIAQKGIDTRAKELTEKFSHTRPNGKRGISAVGECIVEANIENLAACNENIHSGSSTAQGAFNSWMNSEGHRANILSDGISYIVVARCDNYWAMIGIAEVEDF